MEIIGNPDIYAQKVFQKTNVITWNNWSTIRPEISHCCVTSELAGACKGAI